MTGGIAARLEELGLSLPDVAAPVAAYVPAVWHGDLVWTSGQLPIVDGELVATGLVADPATEPAAVRPPAGVQVPAQGDAALPANGRTAPVAVPGDAHAAAQYAADAAQAMPDAAARGFR